MFGYQKNSNIQAKGARPHGQKVTHVVASTLTAGLLQSLLRDRLCREPCEEEAEVQVKGSFLLRVAAFLPTCPGSPEFCRVLQVLPELVFCDTGTGTALPSLGTCPWACGPGREAAAQCWVCGWLIFRERRPCCRKRSAGCRCCLPVPQGPAVGRWRLL